MSRKERGGRFSESTLSFPGRRPRLVIAAVIIALAVLIWSLASQTARQPVYRGKPLALWLQTYAPSSPSVRNSPEWKETDDAVRELGTNCIPILLRMICAKDSALKLRLVALAQKQHFVKIRFVPAAEKNVEASRAFIVLGDAAKGAVPLLIKAYDEDISFRSRGAIADALAWIGPSAKPAIPLLLRAATNSDPQLRANALWALGEIHAEASVCVPRLIDALSDSNGWVQLCAAHALGKFGAEARAAVPSLSRLAEADFKNSRLIANQMQVTLEARNALRKIEPAAETPPGFDFSAFDSPFAPRE